LKGLLRRAKDELPEALGYSQFSDTEFVDRVELRSSLLIQGGHTVEDGHLVPVYEFRHLTFQEYLAARAIITGHYPGRSNSDSPAKLVSKYRHSEAWLEVVPLTAVMSGRDAKDMILDLIRETPQRGMNTTVLLGRCLVDEVQLAPDVLNKALEFFMNNITGHGLLDPTEVLVRAIILGRYGNALEEVVVRIAAQCDDRVPNAVSTLGNIAIARLGWSEDDIAHGKVNLDNVRSLVQSSNWKDQTAGASIVMNIAFTHRRRTGITALGEDIVVQLSSDSATVRHAACWALAWLGANCSWEPREKVQVLLQLARLLNDKQNPHIRRQAAWAICALPATRPAHVRLDEHEREVLDELLKTTDDPAQENWPFLGSQAALTMAYYLGAPWVDSELGDRIVAAVRQQRQQDKQWAKRMLRNLENGAARVERLGPDKNEDADEDK
jgi:hypothetical protein